MGSLNNWWASTRLGDRAVDFVTLSEPGSCREYVALHQHLEVGAGDEMHGVHRTTACLLHINDALGARPDPELLTFAPTNVVNAVTYGRRPMDRIDADDNVTAG
jgi:hypothetical protein